MSEDTTYRIKLYRHVNGRNQQPEPYHVVVGEQALKTEVETIFGQARADSVVIFHEKPFKDDMDNAYTVWRELETKTWRNPLSEARKNLERAQDNLSYREESIAHDRQRVADLTAEVERLAGLADQGYIHTTAATPPNQRRRR